jgi:hypothetical protein
MGSSLLEIFSISEWNQNVIMIGISPNYKFTTLVSQVTYLAEACSRPRSDA